jgi:hypothetical protein
MQTVEQYINQLIKLVRENAIDNLKQYLADAPYTPVVTDKKGLNVSHYFGMHGDMALIERWVSHSGLPSTLVYRDCAKGAAFANNGDLMKQLLKKVGRDNDNLDLACFAARGNHPGLEKRLLPAPDDNEYGQLMLSVAIGGDLNRAKHLCDQRFSRMKSFFPHLAGWALFHGYEGYADEMINKEGKPDYNLLIRMAARAGHTVNAIVYAKLSGNIGAGERVALMGAVEGGQIDTALYFLNLIPAMNVSFQELSTAAITEGHRLLGMRLQQMHDAQKLLKTSLTDLIPQPEPILHMAPRNGQAAPAASSSSSAHHDAHDLHTAAENLRQNVGVALK